MSIKTTDSNFLSPTRYVFIVDTPQMIDISFHCQTVDVPSISCARAETGFRQYTSKLPGDKIEISPFTARFILDEDLGNYNALLEWIVSLPLEDDTSLPMSKMKDLTLIVYNNNNVPKHRFKMQNCFPTELNPVPFTSTNADTQFIYSDVSFEVDWFTLERG